MCDSECYRKLPEGRFFPKAEFSEVPELWILVDSTHDMIIVRWNLLNFYWIFRKPFESRICPNIYRMFRSVDWTHGMIIVKRHFIYLTRAQTLRSDKCATGSIHANRVNDYQRYSMLTVLQLRSMSCTLGNSCSLQAAGDDHSCRYYNPLSAKKDIWKNFCVSDDDKCYDENFS